MAQTGRSDIFVKAQGITGDRASSSTFSGQFDETTGEFSGGFDFDLVADPEGVVWRCAYKRLWSVKLCWGSGPTIPQAILERGGFDLIVESWTTSLFSGPDHPSFATSIGWPQDYRRRRQVADPLMLPSFTCAERPKRS